MWDCVADNGGVSHYGSYEGERQNKKLKTLPSNGHNAAVHVTIRAVRVESQYRSSSSAAERDCHFNINVKNLCPLAPGEQASLADAYQRYSYMTPYLTMSPNLVPFSIAQLPAFEVKIGDFVEVLPDQPHQWGHIGYVEKFARHDLVVDKAEADKYIASLVQSRTDADVQHLRNAFERLGEGNCHLGNTSIDISAATELAAMKDAISSLTSVEYYWVKLVRLMINLSLTIVRISLMHYFLMGSDAIHM
jgi:hypothetical protein